MIDLDSIPLIRARNYTSGRRAPVTMIVIHDMEAPETPTQAENCAQYFAGPNSPQASAHYCCDSDSVVCSVLPSDEAWHSAYGPTNACSVGIEQAGYAAADTHEWLDAFGQAMIFGQVAPLVAALCDRYGIPVRFLDAAAMRAGNMTGITTHGAISEAFVPGGHTDPGPNYPMAEMLAHVRSILDPTPEDDDMTSALGRDARTGTIYHMSGAIKVPLTDQKSVELLTFLGAKWLGDLPPEWLGSLGTIRA